MAPYRAFLPSCLFPYLVRPLKNPAIFTIPKKTMDFFDVTGGRVLKRPAREP
jgi:hypothetical protein